MLSWTARTLGSGALQQGYRLEFKEYTFKSHFEMGKEASREMAKRTPSGDKKNHESCEGEDNRIGGREVEEEQGRNTTLVGVTTVTMRLDE